jgi:hypothetical protein
MRWEGPVSDFRFYFGINLEKLRRKPHSGYLVARPNGGLGPNRAVAQEVEDTEKMVTGEGGERIPLRYHQLGPQLVTALIELTYGDGSF